MVTDSYTVTAGSPDTVQSIFNIVSDTEITEGSNPPEFENVGLNGHPCLLGDGVGRRLVFNESAVVAPFQGQDRSYAVIGVAQPLSAATAVLFGSGNSGIANNDTLSLGTDSLGRWRALKQANGQTSAVTATVRAASAPCVIAWLCQGDNVSIYRNKSRIRSGTVNPLAAMTCNQVGVFCRPDSAPDLFLNARLSCLLVYDNPIGYPALAGLLAALAPVWGLSDS